MSAGHPVDDSSWRALRYFGLYRLIISGLFVVLVLSGSVPPPLGSFDRDAFAVLACVYFVLALVAVGAVEQRVGRLPVQVFAQMLLDTAILTLMMYASGGVGSGVGMLLVVAVAGASMLAVGQVAFLYAALAALAVLLEELYAGVLMRYPPRSLTQAGFLGAGFFATAMLSWVLARRVRESEALALQRAIDLENMARLNEHIVQRMQSGILVLDRGGGLRLANESAARLLALPSQASGQAIGELVPELGAEHARWQVERKNLMKPIRPVRGDVDVIASFTALGTAGESEGTLVFLEDAALTRQRAQQLKLASLGRLTGSIAHEIRNPLGAVSHAAQLLAESQSRSPEDARLTRIIREHSERMNRIVENVLQIGRRSSAMPESFALAAWLGRFVEELVAGHGLEPSDVIVSVRPPSLVVRMDPSQLHQVLWNLCENALRYSRGVPRLELRAAIGPASGRPYLDVVDHGPGMSAEASEHAFEPFFTSEASGTGLGLYIARELCEANQAALTLVRSDARGCSFRINFAHPDRQQPRAE